ncbi:XdhC family protein [Sphingosinicella xenopeptidilytica]|uniref:XdhC family protein n=1 Tax=Sphingosinicella xenopeptidilytica TaxID=364098 RepID=A0ABW3C1Z5_SPHXN
MNGDDTAALIATLRNWIAAGHKAAIATVIETWGSAPRRTGAHLVIRDDGLFEGSVSGGCVEGDVIAAAADVIADNAPRRLEYGVADARAWEVGLACGGRIAVLVQPVSEEGFAPALADRLGKALTNGESVRVTTDADGVSREGEHEGFARLYEPAGRLMIIGAVHIAQALVPMAELLGYVPLVVDPRGSFAAAERFSHITVDTRWPDEALADWKPDSASAIVALTHDPKLDDPALIAALNSPAFYIAALGSRKNQAIRRERLAAVGFNDTALARVHGPAGLAIGAANPAEIALSIAAQMIAVRRGA